MDAMIEKCFDEGQIQAFLDGELEGELLEQVARHVSICDDCAILLAEAESESAFAFAALDGELNSLVPTERIRTNLYEAIAAEKKPFWKRIFGENFRFTNPSLAAFASLALVVGIFTILFVVREYQPANPSNEIAKVENPKTVQTPNNINRQPQIPVNSTDNETPEVSSPTTRVQTVSVKASFENRPVIQRADYKIQRSPIKNQAPKLENNTDTIASSLKNESLAGEDSYIKTIATLSETVNSRKDEVLRPSARVAFEKDLAIVDDSITKMQKEVRSNPKNEAAKQLLRSSYQNKIDLLNSVADKNDLMASLK